MKDKKKNPLTIVALMLIIITIIFIVVGLVFVVVNFVSSFFKEDVELNENRIKELAISYTTENEMEWTHSYIANDEEVEYACVSVEKLINDGYVDGSKLYNLSITNYLIVTRNMDKKVISSEFLYDDNICREVVEIDVPKEGEICNELRYDGFSHGLVNTSLGGVGYNYVNSSQVDAGSYPVKLSLYDYYVWKGNDNSEKEILCTIEKATPNLLLSSYGNAGNEVLNVVTTLSSNISGMVYVKTSNVNNVVVDEVATEVVASVDKDITINIVASSDEITYVTITVIPDSNYSKNYYSGSVRYTVGNIDNKSVPVPSAEEYCKKNLVYNQNLQSLTKTHDAGFRFLGTKGINAGDYKITAVLDYGYTWSDGTIDNKEFYCEISKEVPLVLFSSGETDVIKEQINYFELSTEVKGRFEVNSNNSVEVVEIKSFGDNSSSFYQLFLKGKAVENDALVNLKFIPEEENNYEVVELNYKLNVLDNEATLNYDVNGGNACSSSSKKIYYGESYGELCTPYKDGYEFIGWYSDKDDRTNMIDSSTVVESVEDVTIYAHYKKAITLTLIQYEGEEVKTEQVMGEMYNDDKGAVITLPTASEYFDNQCSGWINIGWTTRQDVFDSGVEYKNSSEYSFKKDLTLYAKYERKVIFSYDTNGGEKINSRVEYLYRNASGQVSGLGKWIEYVKKVPTKSNCKFIGWYNDTELMASASDLENDKSVAIDFGCGGYKLVAKWDCK